MIDADDIELAVVRSSFCLLIARWRLTQAEVAMALGETVGPFAPGRVLPDILDASAETRLRLLVRLDRAFERISPSDDIAVRMRDPDALGVGIAPLEAIRDVRVLRAAVGMAEKMSLDLVKGEDDLGSPR